MTKNKIAVIGLGYVGFPLLIELSKKYTTVGFDIKSSRIKELNSGYDSTGEVAKKYIVDVKPALTDNPDKLKGYDIYIITVPTPVDKSNRPNLNPLSLATKMVGGFIEPGATIIYESTVFPGCVEDFCVPILEKESELVFNKDFYCGYSPERINPGDKNRTITKIVKVTAGSNAPTSDLVDEIYKSIIIAGTYRASSIKVAEAAKVIENAQRDINIAFINELSKIFSKMEIDTNDVLAAASTKWNFLQFTPGLVGGHCIGVDPYYLSSKAEELGYNPEIILAGRKLNNSMGSFIASEAIEIMNNKNIPINDSNALILGITFKENCPDIRNTKVVDIIDKLVENKINIDVYDPNADKEEVQEIYGINLLDNLNNRKYNLIILAVPHDIFSKIDLTTLKSDNSVIYDVKNFVGRDIVDGRL
ncbi:hypothetical protein CL656_04455 [bacterium]|nr:hypothetical protein [bacterium]